MKYKSYDNEALRKRMVKAREIVDNAHFTYAGKVSPTIREKVETIRTKLFKLTRELSHVTRELKREEKKEQLRRRK